MKILFSEDEVRDAVHRLARELELHYEDRPLLIVGVATGAIVFMGDLIRRLQMPVRIEIVRASSYRGESTRPGDLTVDLGGLTKDDVRDSNVLLVDDIFDTGRTLLHLSETLRACDPVDLRTAVLLEKPDRCEVAMRPDFVALKIPDKFVVGYGLDYDGRHRNLPFIGVLEEDER